MIIQQYYKDNNTFKKGRPTEPHHVDYTIILEEEFVSLKNVKLLEYVKHRLIIEVRNKPMLVNDLSSKKLSELVAKTEKSDELALKVINKVAKTILIEHNYHRNS